MAELRLIFGICILLFLLVGCNSSYKDCTQDCYWEFKNDVEFEYNSTCDDRYVFEALIGIESRYVDCKRIDYDKVNKFCYNECKPN